MARDTHIPRLKPEVLSEVRPMCISALAALDFPTDDRVWADTVPEKRVQETPYITLGGEQENASRYETLNKYGMGFDLEVRVVSDLLKETEELAGAVKKRVTSIDAPPEPDGYQHLYTEPLAGVPPEALGSGQSDLHETLVRTRLYYRTAN